jgi:hypothetical protein
VSVIEGLRGLADFLEQNPLAPTPDHSLLWKTFDKWRDGDDAAETFLAAVEAIDATITRPTYSDAVRAVRPFGAVDYHFEIDEKLVGEKRTVTREEFALPAALETRVVKDADPA